MSITELIELFMDMPETMVGLKSEGEFVVLDTRKVADELKKSLRNCDVGTTDDQIDRMLAFCGRKGKCSKCEHHKIGTLFRQCTLRWAQMPYEKGGAE